jgi:hypothetical protein
LNVQGLWYHVEGVLCDSWMPRTLFHFRNVPGQTHSTFLIYPVGFFTWDSYVEDAGAGVFRGVVFLLHYPCSLLVHEFAHVFTTRHWGLASRCVILIPLGAVAELDPTSDVPSGMWIALAGPLGSFTLAGVFWLALHWLRPPGLYWFLEIRPVLRFGYALSLIVAIFNNVAIFSDVWGPRCTRGASCFHWLRFSAACRAGAPDRQPGSRYDTWRGRWRWE